MSFCKPPVVASSVALLAALSLVPTQAWARGGGPRAGGGEVIYEMAPMSTGATQDIIYEMPPLKPAKGAAAQATKPAAKPSEPPVAAKPAPTPVQEAAPASPPAPVAEAPKPVAAQPVAEAPATAAPIAAAAPEAVAQQPAPAEAPVVSINEAPAAPPAEASPSVPPQLAGEEAAPAPVEGQGAVQPTPPEQPVVAEAPAIVEPAPIGPPVMSVNPTRKALAALKAPAAFAGHVASLQGDAPAPSLVPKLRSLAPEAAPETVAAQPGAEAQPPQTEAAVDAAGVQAPADAKISALLAEGLVGPVEVRIGDRATMWLPAGRVFLPLETARKLAQEAGLEWRPGVQGMVAPAGGKLEWLAPVELLDDGYVKTGDADSLQPEKLLAAFQASLPEVNAQRARADQPPVALDGWLSPPALNEKHRLAGCVNISTQNDQSGLDKFFNCEAWALGRQGAIKIGLADGAEAAARLKDEAAALADTIVFDRGKTYEEFDAAMDRTAPYAVADLLTRDVAAKTAPTPPAVEESAPEAPSDLISKLFYPAVFGVGALALYALVKRRRDAQKDDEAQAGTAAAPKRIEKAPEQSRVAEAPPSATEALSAEAAPSLFARLLPTLHALLSKKTEPAAKPPIFAEEPAPAAAPKAEPVAAEKSEPALGGLMGKLAALRSRNSGQPKPGAAPVAPATASDAEEPVSALKKLAARMRRTSEEPAPAPVNVSRVIRTPRIAGAAAAAVVEHVAEPLIVEMEKAQGAAPPEPAAKSFAAEEAQEAEMFAPPPVEEKSSVPQSMFDEDDFGLVEPGDVEAASSALDASRKRRASDI